MIHVILPVGLLQCNCSVFGDEQTREAIVIDPGDEIEKVTAVLEQHRLKVKAIVITHGHIDHVMGANQLRALTGAPVYLNENDKELLAMIAVQASWLGMDAPPRWRLTRPRPTARCCILAKRSSGSSIRPGTRRVA